MMNEEIDPLDDCTTDEIVAMLWDQTGPEGLKMFLDQAGCDRETLSDAADKLQRAGLTQAAELVRAAAVQAASRASVEIAKVMDDPVENNRKAYLASAYRNGRITMYDLVPQGLDSETLAYIERSKITYCPATPLTRREA